MKQPQSHTITHQKETRRHRLKRFLLILGILCALFLVLGASMIYFLLNQQELDESKLVMHRTSVMLDNEGQEVAKFFIENRNYLKIDETPLLVKKAFLAVEDRRFYQHNGIDGRGIIRALYRDILARSKVEGGSTITQQLVKNILLHREKSWLRKTEEIILATKLEKIYTKDEILEMYLNYIYFGHGAYGIDAAAERYFGKEVQELEIGEIAMLAALPKAPNHYSPLHEGNEERSEKRRKIVLNVMKDEGLITEREWEAALESPLALNKENGIYANEAYFTYIDMVLEEAQKEYGISEEEILSGGYTIHTALNTTAQEAVNEAFSLDSEISAQLFPANGPRHPVEGSMIILNHDTGAIVAISGGREYVRKGYNRATQAKRQPGSSFKPIAVYATALEQGWSPYDDIQDQLINYNGYQPRNYDGVYRGKVQMKEAVEWSYNAPAVWLLHEIGIDHGIELAQKFGFHDLDRELGIALGSVKASPLQMASAFGAFANDGVLVKPYVIEKIVTPSGESIVEVQKDETQVVSAQTAWAMTTLLQGVIQNGTGKQAQLTHDVAGKTGTTQSSERGKNVRDAWFVGYTPQYSAAVWIGFDQMDAEHRMESSGGNHPAKIFRYVMDKMLEGEEVLHFSKPEGVHNLLPKSKKKNEKAEQKEKKGKKDQKDSKKKKDREDKKNKKNKKEKQDRKREN